MAEDWIFGRSLLGPFMNTKNAFKWRHVSKALYADAWEPGNGSQWAGMAADLMDENRLFAQRVEECATVLKQHYAFDLLSQFNSDSGWSGALEASVGLTALQIGLVDVLADEFGIKPAGFFGHSAGKTYSGTMTT